MAKTFVPNPVQLADFIKDKMGFKCEFGYCPFVQHWMLNKTETELKIYIDELNNNNRELYKWVLAKKIGAARTCGRVDLTPGKYCFLAVNYDLNKEITGFEPIDGETFDEFKGPKPEVEVDTETETLLSGLSENPPSDTEEVAEEGAEGDDEEGAEEDDEEDDEVYNRGLINDLQCQVETLMFQITCANNEIGRLNGLLNMKEDQIKNLNNTKDDLYKKLIDHLEKNK